VRKKFLIFIGSVLLGIGIIVWMNRPVTDVDEVYLLQKDFKGCVWIYYNQPNAKSLEIVNKEITYRIPDNGVLHTSSPADFGNLGWHKIKAFFVDKQGNRIVEIPFDMHNYGFINGNNHPISQSSWMLFDSSKDFCQ
jgi:hypothetical protein